MFEKRNTFGKPNDQIQPCIKRRREAQKLLYVFFIKQIQASTINSIEKRPNKTTNNLFKGGLPGFVITLDIPVQVGFTENATTFLKDIKLRYAVFLLDLKADENENNDFIYWELLSVYDINTTTTMSPKQNNGTKTYKD